MPFAIGGKQRPPACRSSPMASFAAATGTSSFMWGLNGVERRTSRTGYMFHDEETTADTAVVTGSISGENHPFVEHV